MPRSKGRTGRPWRRLSAETLAVRPLICWLCDGEINPDLPYRNPYTGDPDPLYKTVHHIVPLSRGGAELDPDNCAPAHSVCNQRAGDKLPWELPGRQHWIHGEDP